MSTQVCTGTFTNVASQPYFLPLEQYVSKFELMNLSQLNSYTSARITNATWYDYMGNGVAVVDAPTTITGPLNTSAVIRTKLAQGGITLFNPYNQVDGAAVAVSSFTPGTTTVWTTGTAHGFIVGDTVRVYSLTSAPQFGGLAMTVTAIGGGGTTFTTLLDSTGATTSVGFVKKTGNYLLPTKSGVYPENRVIAKMTNANPMVITTLVQQNYAVGDVVTFDMPSIFGVPQLSQQTSGLPVQGTVVAANNAVGTQTVSININSTNFGVFATSSGLATNPGHWPLAAGYPFSFPVMVPQGEGNTNNLLAYSVAPTPLPYANQDVLSFTKQNIGYRGILIGAGDGTAAASTGGLIGASADVWLWTATTSLQQFPQI